MDESAELIHATCVAIGDVAVLIRGPSGSGKSDLALRLLYTPLPERFGNVQLISDDQVRLSVQGTILVAHTAPNLSNRMEVRQIGIVHQTTRPHAPVRLSVDATDPKDLTRMPTDGERWASLLGVRVARLALNLTEPSSIAKILCALDEHHRTSAPK